MGKKQRMSFIKREDNRAKGFYIFKVHSLFSQFSYNEIRLAKIIILF